MTRFLNTMAVFSIGLALVAAMADVAEAQRGQGGGGFGGGGRGGRGGRGGLSLTQEITKIQLAGNEQVQTALSMTEAETAAVAALNDEYVEARQEVLTAALADAGDDAGAGGGRGRRGGGRGFGGFNLSPEVQTKVNELNAQYATKVAEAIGGKAQRLQQIYVQVNGSLAINNDAEVARALGVTDEVKTKLTEARTAAQEELTETAQDELADLTGDERRAKQEELRAAADKKILESVLTAEQQTQFAALQGEPANIDRSQLTGGGFGGRGGFGGGGGGGRRGRGGRGGQGAGDGF
jgi:Spy/CpxP family protein refolding chaperone